LTQKNNSTVVVVVRYTPAAIDGWQFGEREKKADDLFVYLDPSKSRERNHARSQQARHDKKRRKDAVVTEPGWH
jgi:hypothetical protein